MTGKKIFMQWLVCAVVLVTSACAGMEKNDPAQVLERQVSGLWRYTGLTTGDGQDLPLTGIFLFKDGVFMQQAVFNSEPYDLARSMAHAGPYQVAPATGSVHLVAEQTISLLPGENPALNFRSDTDHDVTVTREGDNLTLIFGMGTSTVQEFAKIGPGRGDLYRLENGALAFVDGHFLLVDGDGAGVTTGYGTYTRRGENLTLNVIRWSEGDAAEASNLKDVTLSAKFDGRVLTLADGKSFTTQ